jgi:phosphatidylglycerophosphate synthase
VDALDDTYPFFHTALERWIQEGRVKTFRAEPDHLCYPIDSLPSVKKIEKGLYKTAAGSLDGFVDTFLNRPVSKLLTPLFLKTPMTPNGITLLSFAIGILAALFFARGGYLNAIFGALLFQLSSMIDCCDGEVARLKFMESPLGKWLDITCDNIVYLMIFSGITWSVIENATGRWLLGWGLSSLVGILLSFIMVTLSLKQQEPSHIHSNKTTAQTLQKIRWLIAKTANRDFSVLILIFALLDNLPWFLILTAIGSNLFWLTLLGLHLRIRWQT